MGLAMIEALRREGDQTPVLFLSALGEITHRVEGLKAGGDDYLVKPYAFAELTARVEGPGPASRDRLGPDPAARRRPGDGT